MSGCAMSGHSITACLARWGWRRSDRPASELEECVDESGCSRAGRWSKWDTAGVYCAQHAHQGGPRGFGGHS